MKKVQGGFGGGGGGGLLSGPCRHIPWLQQRNRFVGGMKKVQAGGGGGCSGISAGTHPGNHAPNTYSV